MCYFGSGWRNDSHKYDCGFATSLFLHRPIIFFNSSPLFNQISQCLTQVASVILIYGDCFYSQVVVKM